VVKTPYFSPLKQYFLKILEPSPQKNSLFSYFDKIFKTFWSKMGKTSLACFELKAKRREDKLSKKEPYKKNVNWHQ